MGTICSNGKTRPLRKLPSIIPPDYQTQLGESPITFKIIIQNIKIKCLPFDETQVHISVDSVKEITTSIIQNNTDPHWKILEKFDYTNTQEGLKQAFFTLPKTVFYFRNKVRKQFSQVRFSLWEVAIGPIHHDLFLESKQFESSKSRITFDLKMVQRVKIKIVTRTMKCDLNDQLIEKAYNFQLRIKSHKLDYESELSPNCINPQYQKRKKQQQTVQELQRQSPNWKGIQAAQLRSVGDLKLVRDSLEYEIGDLYDQFDHDQDMDENVKKALPIVMQQTHSGTFKMVAPEKQNRMKKTLSNTNIPKLKTHGPQLPFSMQTLKPHPLSKIHLSQSMHNLEKPLSYFSLSAKRDLCWDFNKSDNREVPQIQFDIYMDEFTSSTFEFVLWGNRNPKEGGHSDNFKSPTIAKPNLLPKKEGDSDSDESLEHYINHKLIGHSYISMNRFCSADVSILAEVERMLIQEVRFEERLQKHTVAIGIVKGEFLMSHNPFLRQMMGGIKTEQGIQKASILYVRKDKYISKLNSHINRIMEISLQLDELMGNLNAKETTHRQRVQINEQIAMTVSALDQQIDDEHEELYRNEEELNRAQIVLIDISKNLLKNADMIDEQIRSNYYQLLIKLLHRPEFQLAYMGFDRKQLELYACRNQPQTQRLCKKELEFLEQKMHTQLHYQNFLYKTLEIVFQKIQQRGSNVWENQFVYNFLVQAYFKIPEFKTCLLSAIKQDTRLLNQDLEKNLLDLSITLQNDFYWFIHEWQKLYYEIIVKTSRGQEHIQYLKGALSQISWNRIVHKQNYVILRFIAQMCKDIKKSKGHLGSIPWQDLPGYGWLVKHFLIELKECDQYPFPEVFKDVSISLLENELLLNNFLFVIYSKTKIYDSLSVYYTFDMISFWFEFLRSRNKKVPTDFNFIFFMKGIYMIFEGEHALSIAKALQIVYNIFTQMPSEVQGDFCDHTFDKYFFKFFMFWSKTVRWVFFQFLIYRIQHLYRNPKTTDTNKVRDIVKEFQVIKTKREVKQIQQQKESLINDMIYLKYSQMIEIVVKMKKIISKNMQQQEKNLLQAQLEAHSWKLKLIKKKIYRKRKRRSSESPGNDEAIDFSLQSLKSSLNSLTYHQHSESIQYQSENEFEGRQFSSKFIMEQISNQNDAYYENLLEERSLSSILNLDEILQELAVEKRTTQRGNVRMNSVQLCIRNQSEIMEEKDGERQRRTPRKVTIYHHMNRFSSSQSKLEIPKELLKYLIPAMTEWQEQQANYKRWYLMKRGELMRQRLLEEELQKQMMQLSPPEILLRVPKDESESNINVEEEW